MSAVLDYIIANKAQLAVVLFAVLGLASAIAYLTPTDSDNKVLDVIYKIVNALGLTKKE